MTRDDIWPPRAPWVGRWLLVVCVLVLAMIMVGGATRLTDSGLSITEWDLGKGISPPLSEARWREEFALYQRTTEYQEQNYGMSLDEFRTIYWWEWGHRFLGKLLGIVFALPFFFFLFTGRLRGRFRVSILLFALGGLQGAVGWWMVTSGLFQSLDVSPLRLAIHLALAFVILAISLWVALGAFGWPASRSRLGAPKWAPLAFMVLLFAQIMLGALLAGARGGPAYADWPTIGGDWIPETAFALVPWFENLTADHATQHLLHRSGGYLVALAAIVLALIAAVRGEGASRWTATAVGGLALFQAGLGIATVVMGSPLWLGLTHQFAAALLWMAGLISLKAVWR